MWAISLDSNENLEAYRHAHNGLLRLDNFTFRHFGGLRVSQYKEKRTIEVEWRGLWMDGNSCSQVLGSKSNEGRYESNNKDV